MDMLKFSDEQIAGQRLMVGFDGTDLNKDLKFLIDTIKVGGIILFSRNLSDPDQMKNLCSSAQEYAKSCVQPPLFIAVDQEGGQVARLKKPFTQFPDGNPGIKDESDAKNFAGITASELGDVGINMDMAPVMDVMPKGFNGVMEKRVFSHDPNMVAKLGIEVIKKLQKENIMAVAKHFPGIGRTTLDSHIDQPFLDLELSRMKPTDLLPFKSAIENSVAGVMLSHIFYRKIDPKWPASLSESIAKDLLRVQMGFEGVVMTDDLDMGAIKKYYDMKIAIRQILLADIDIALICHKGPNIQTAFETILKSVGSSKDAKENGLASVTRIMKLKGQYLL
jgi:beta-N-acetylhexosaminidase